MHAAKKSHTRMKGSFSSRFSIAEVDSSDLLEIITRQATT